MSDALKWLNKFEKLIGNNEDLFLSKHVLCRYNKLINLIEKKRSEVVSSRIKEPVAKTPEKFINAESEDRHFPFYEIKKQFEKINDDNQKMFLLTKEMFEYQQANIEFINQKTPFYDAKCTKEIENICALQKTQAAIEQAKNYKTGNHNSKSGNTLTNFPTIFSSKRRFSEALLFANTMLSVVRFQL